jgi:hypothetical protein
VGKIIGIAQRGVLKIGVRDWRSEKDQWDNNGILRGEDGLVKKKRPQTLSLAEPRALATLQLEWRKYKKKVKVKQCGFSINLTNQTWRDLDSEITCYISKHYSFLFVLGDERG